MDNETVKKYTGKYIYALVTRGGGAYGTIHKLVSYIITKNGTFKYSHDCMICVANKAQYAELERTTSGNYWPGRPTAAQFDEKRLIELINQ